MGEGRKTGCVAGGCGLFLAIMVIGAICVAIFNQSPSSPQSSEIENPKPAPVTPVAKTPPKQEDDLFQVCELARSAVRSSLKAPRSAEFSGLTDTKMAPYGYNQWIVSGFVDAQNSFGVMLRYDWVVLMVKSAGSWQAVCGGVGDGTWGKIPAPAPWPAKPLTPEQIAAAKAAAALMKQKTSAAALKYNRDLADKGDAYGQLRMGERYATGDGVEKDLVRARDLLSKSAAQGNPEASAELKKLPPQEPRAASAKMRAADGAKL
jgi:hypothetical protein